ncbi:cytochrome c biogenesis factor [Schinkia azotoformans MEV2011]|uniref:Cytochrome c biogenesis factor n=1 Tax=Schinkia azotoformans MEV2011 TaxID=1348973 RepID=A0A072NPF4_SCHAZ|nr:heme lyase CcmF/NrfE family subunit [Schinkia azotoformans]KEF39366.1 cytochrome c biogenesis factor [Schinkia azotoformans MEV2011]MEC1694882.1 heme lyase CcmF/NrfE family subunit [Schinkia azotoformans]MEC1726716.1 heme lyase CcmF/NrfE family subunit [Schinkia azotoformans]MEC1779745.1 heme lyase CcmF/NrfE family subunit [Schinkia azotoformans]MED4327564.1 heme lyase CcmF/NrfE family subunit [Schinkia azotoformans]
MYIIGTVTIYLGLAISIYALIAFIIGIRKQNQSWINSGKNSVLMMFFISSILMTLLFLALGTDQYQFKYVSTYTSSDLALIYKLCALWAGNAGSLLLWTFFLTMYNAMVTFSKKMKANPMVPYISSILLGNTIFFYFLLATTAKPFELNEVIPREGNGLNPMLQDPGMILHPVTLYLGYVGMAVPFAFAIAALMLKNVDSFWIRMTRRWTLLAWLFLTLGNVIGGWWAYLELGWGGYWAWDPVENASFMPWLTVTAFLHSVMIQERKQMLKVWNLSLIILSYSLTLFGTFLVRSGVLTSVHAFGDSNLGTYFLIFMAFAVIFAMYVMMSRYQLLKKDSGQFESFLSKESSFLINNLILVGATFAVFWGTIFPLVSEAVKGTKVTVGIPFFNTVMSPILLGLMFVMAVCPLIAWQKSTVKNLQKNFVVPALLSIIVAVILFVFGIRGAYPLISFGIVSFMLLTHILEIYRGVRARRSVTKEAYPVALVRLMRKNRRRYGGYTVHFGIALMAIGIIGSQNFDVETMKTVAIGETIQLENFKVTYEELGQKREGMNDVVYAVLSVEKDDKKLGKVIPEKIFFGNNNQPPSTRVGLLSSWEEDLYTVLSTWEADKRATFVVRINPLVKWIWTGGIVVIIGTLFAIWGGKYNQITPRYTGAERKVS